MSFKSSYYHRGCFFFFIFELSHEVFLRAGAVRLAELCRLFYLYLISAFILVLGALV